MTTRSLNNHDEIKDKFNSLLLFNNEHDESEHEATILSLQFISAFNELMGKSVSKKDVADALGTSKSYVTQLFNGSKLLNLPTIIKIQHALNAKVKINVVANEAPTMKSQMVTEKSIRIKRENTIDLPLVGTKAVRKVR